MSKDIESRLLEVQSAIETAKRNKARSEGVLMECKKQLKQDFKVSDVKSAKALLASMNDDLEKNTVKLEKSLTALEEKVNALAKD